MNEPNSSPTPLSAFVDYARVVKAEVERALGDYFDVLDREHARTLPMDDIAPVVDALRALVLRGGKRTRAVLLAAAFEACGGGDRARVFPALVAIELLHGYLLVHDDWMDGDEERRGGPSVHAALRDPFDASPGRRHDADACAILAGDFAAGLALSSLASCALPSRRIARASRAFGDLQRNVVLGQLLDVRGSVERSRNPRHMLDTLYEMKTGSYTVAGPFAIGALLADASAPQLDALARAARPLGIAFQWRDDLLGTFGNPKVTGKSVSGDLKQGKTTALILEASDATIARELAELRTSKESPEVDARVEQLRRKIDATGARKRVEERIETLVNEASQMLDSPLFTENGKQILLGAAAAIGRRDQ